MRVRIEDGDTVEGLALMLEEYGRIFEQIANAWESVAKTTPEDRDNIPPPVWMRDAKSAHRIASALYLASDDLREVWGRAPADLRLALDIKVRKPKELTDD